MRGAIDARNEAPAGSWVTASVFSEWLDAKLLAELVVYDGELGALAKGSSYVPGKQGARIYFSTADIEETLRKTVAAGGKLLYPKTSIGELGWVAEFEDSEGNCIALHSEPALKP